MQHATDLLKRLKETRSPLHDLVKHVLDLPRGDGGYCPKPWNHLFVAIASNHACAGGLIKIPTLVLPVLSRLIEGNLLDANDKLTLFK